MKFLYISMGGALGAILRYVISGFTFRFFDKMFPWGTLSVNLIGAFIIGFLYTFFEYLKIDSSLKIFVFVGILGAFTTFSTYCLETVNLLRDGEYKYALINIIISNITGILLVILGIVIARMMITKTI